MFTTRAQRLNKQWKLRILRSYCHLFPNPCRQVPFALLKGHFVPKTLLGNILDDLTFALNL